MTLAILFFDGLRQFIYSAIIGGIIWDFIKRVLIIFYKLVKKAIKNFRLYSKHTHSFLLPEDLSKYAIIRINRNEYSIRMFICWGFPINAKLFQYLLFMISYSMAIPIQYSPAFRPNSLRAICVAFMLAAI